MASASRSVWLYLCSVAVRDLLAYATTCLHRCGGLADIEWPLVLQGLRLPESLFFCLGQNRLSLRLTRAVNFPRIGRVSSDLYG